MVRILSAVVLVSSSAIAYEILLMRLLSIVQWHHFAYMVISLALLGYGASGTAIALTRRWLKPHFESAFALSALLFSISMVACYALGQRVPFNALEVVWNPRQLLNLGVMYMVFMLPFFFAASCIGLAFTVQKYPAQRIYLSDLVGAGVGAALIIAALFVLLPRQALVLLAAWALAASVLASAKAPGGRIMLLPQTVWAVSLAVILLAGLPHLRMSQFKGLSQALQATGSQIVTERSSPLGQLTVVQNHRIPFRHAAGLSFATRFIPPEQLAVFSDGDSMSVINRWAGEAEAVAYLGDMTSALPYRLLESPRVLILGAGAGSDVLQALFHGASAIDAVELNPQMIGLVKDTYAAYAGQLYSEHKVHLHVGEARGFVARSQEQYDLIQIGLLDSFAVSGSGVMALDENYLYTVEAIREYLGRLRPGGLLAITRWLKIPPRDSLRLAATTIEALRQEGIHDAGRHLTMIRSWNTVTLLISHDALTGQQIQAASEFTRTRSFDTAWRPGLNPAEVNHFNRLEQPWFYQGFAALLSSDADVFIGRYKFNIEPATDNRPYFFNFFRWRVLPEVVALRERGGAALVEWGYLVPAATLLQALLAGLLLILLPLARVKSSWPAGVGRCAGLYFFLIGLAFLFIEIAFIQKFILFLSHPLYSVAVVLAGFLVFAGIGSGLSDVMAKRAAAMGHSPIRLVVLFIAVVSLGYALLLPLLFNQWLGLPDAVRIGLSLVLIAPIAVCMGMPFPLGMKKLAASAPDFIPWAWGINGFASVISSALATLLAIQFGFTAVLMLALLLYLGAAAVA